MLAFADIFYFGNVVGDTNDDGAIDDADFSTVVGEFGLRGGSELIGDFNVDGRVDLSDFAIVRGNFGNTVGMPTLPPAAPAAAPAPESQPDVNLLLDLPGTQDEGNMFAAAYSPAASPASLDPAAIDLPVSAEQSSALFDSAISDDLLLEGVSSSGGSVGAVLDTSDLLVDILAESPLEVGL